MEDRQIIELYFDRNEQAIAETQKKYGAYCHTVAIGILTSREDAEDCVNDTWLRAWNSIPPARPDHLQLYLGGITRHLSLDRYRTLHREKRGGGELVLALDEMQELASPDTDVRTQAEEQAFYELLNDFLRALPERERKIFIRRYYYVDSIPSIAKRYALTRANVKKILSRTREKLREYLTKEGYTV